MLSRVLTFGVSHRVATLLFLGFVSCVACAGLLRLQVDTGFTSLIPETDPDLPVYDRIAREFGSDNRTIVYVRDPQLWSPGKLAALEKLHYELEKLDFVERVDDLFTLRSIRAVGGKIDSRIFLPEAPKSQEAADLARRNALHNPLVVGNILSEDGTVTALMVSVREDRGDPGFDRRVTEAIDKTLRPATASFERVFQVGPPRINTDLETVLFNDLKRLGPLSAAVLVLAIILFLRSWLAAVVPLVTSALSIAWTFGMMGWTGIPLNILSAMLPPLIIVIGSTEDTHMIASYFHGLAEAEGDQRSFAARFMMKHMGVPLVLTILTTAIGFASNIFGSIGLIKSFAVASTFAILSNGVITLLLVPLILAALGPRRGRFYRDPESETGLPAAVVRVFRLAKAHSPRTVLVGTAILCCFFVYQASDLHVTNDPLSYLREDQPLLKDTQRIHHDLAGMKLFFINLASEEAKAFQQPKNIEKLVAIQEFLGKQGVFDRSISLADHLALVNREFYGGRDEYFKAPLDRQLIAQYLLFFHRSDLERYVSHDFQRANIVVRHNITDSSMLNRHVRELREVVASIAGSRMKGLVVGENLMVNASAEGLMVAQVRSLAILLCVIFFTMSALFTSLRGGLISLIPNLIPIALMFGIMGLFRIPLNPGTAMVAVIAIGIAIDGTIHLLSRYNELCRRTTDYEGAVSSTVREEATPMVATSLALALGFGILLMSDFTLVAQFGALSAATVLFALFANLLITPLIMTRIRLVGLYQILTLSMHKEVLEKCRLFQGMSNYQMRKAILISELNEFEEGELLLEQGTHGRSMYLILSGKVDVARRLESETRGITVLGPGEIYGEVGFVREIHRTADVRALTHVEALRFDYEKLEKDLKFFPYTVSKLNFNISYVLGERLANLTEEQEQE